MLFVIFLVSLGFAFIYIYNARSRYKRSLPAGIKETPIEKGLPIIGVLLRAEFPFHNYLVKLGKKHGNIFRIMFGMREIIILNNIDIIQKALKEDGDNFSGRWKTTIFSIMNHDSGILFKDGEVWAKQKSFLLKILRDSGFGKSKSYEIVQDECQFLLEDLDRLNGIGTDISGIISGHTANIISKFIMNKRFSHGDPTLKLIENLIAQTGKSKDYVHLFYMMFPALDKSEFVYKIFEKLSPVFKMLDEIHMFFQNEIEEHLKVLDMNSEGKSLIDKFLLKQHQMRKDFGSVESFTDWQLIRISFELFIAGYETTSTTLIWGLVFMSHHPDVQDKIYSEIIDEIGMDKPPTMNDKKYLIYTQAVMDEILRLSSVAPMAIAHRTLSDTIVDGHFIPKNTLVFPNLYACHTDPNVWANPKEFYPEHFLITEHNEKTKYNPREELIPFGIGKRQCLGESLARMEYFIFFVNIIRRFRVKFAEEVSESKYQDVLHGNEGFLRVSLMTDFKFEKRIQNI